MAPRGRPRKRLSRMDAATDAMTAFGFDERLVQKTVKQLLKEYGGDDGWAFIEEYGYKELIEAILRDQESNDEDSTKQKHPAGCVLVQAVSLCHLTVGEELSSCQVESTAQFPHC
ncbi:hypothetical protein MTR67_026295 [Solanum verrucosum]|uniref:WIYLD domain-containing protein n=1 Tax=Solanum verrucosum TaxID=315347 RepID=A0AAF0R582_SOLVR|nr:hypothetical protein MTR67_026295 [Solanum verrucosum]